MKIGKYTSLPAFLNHCARSLRLKLGGLCFIFSHRFIKGLDFCGWCRYKKDDSRLSEKEALDLMWGKTVDTLKKMP